MSYAYFSKFYDTLTSNIPYRTRGEYFHAILKQNPPPGPILLDLACGTGSLSEVMASLSYDVIGVDSSEEMLMEAMNKKYDSGLDILYLCQDMTALDLYGTVDCCICALDSLNHLPNSEAVLKAFQNVSLFLAPDGIFIFDMNTIYKHEKVLSDKVFVYDTDDVFCVWQNSPCHDHTIDITLDFFAEAHAGQYTRETETFSERAYSHDEICALIEQAELSLLTCYKGDTFDPPDETTERVVYVTKSKKQKG